jgi:hypothetical protein
MVPTPTEFCVNVRKDPEDLEKRIKSQARNDHPISATKQIVTTTWKIKTLEVEVTL